MFLCSCVCAQTSPRQVEGETVGEQGKGELGEKTVGKQGKRVLGKKRVGKQGKRVLGEKTAEGELGEKTVGNCFDVSWTCHDIDMFMAVGACLHSSLQETCVYLAPLQTICCKASGPDAGDELDAGGAKKGKFIFWRSTHVVTGAPLHIAKIKDRKPSLVLREDSRQVMCCVIDRLGALTYGIVVGIVHVGL